MSVVAFWGLQFWEVFEPIKAVFIADEMHLQGSDEEYQKGLHVSISFLILKAPYTTSTNNSMSKKYCRIFSLDSIMKLALEDDLIS